MYDIKVMPIISTIKLQTHLKETQTTKLKQGKKKTTCYDFTEVLKAAMQSK
jgi:hypothetical protein